MGLRSLFDPLRFLGLVRKEVKVLMKDRFAVFIMLLLPTLIILSISGNEESKRIENPKIGLVDLDTSEGYPDRDASAEFGALCQEYALVRDKIYLVQSDNMSELNQLLGQGYIQAYIIIKEGFEYNLSVNFPTILTVKMDSYDYLLMEDLQERVDHLIVDYRDRYGYSGAFDVEWNKVNMPEQAQLIFKIAPFFFPWVLFSIAVLVASQSVVSDVPKDRLIMTPANKFEIIIAKVAGIQFFTSILCLLQVFLSLSMGFQIRTDIFTYFFVLWIVGLSGVTLGVMLSCLAQTPLAAFQLFIFFFLSQAIIIFFVPDETLQSLFPVYNGQGLISDVVIRGIPIGESLVSIWPIIYFILFTFVFSELLFQRRKAIL
ncbi:MAG: ABC transporter permease [Candidatus Hodarchaeales archaeon]